MHWRGQNVDSGNLFSFAAHGELEAVTERGFEVITSALCVVTCGKPIRKVRG